MKRVIGYLNGKTLWSENVPSQSDILQHRDDWVPPDGLSSLGGELLISTEPGQYDRQRAAETQRRYKARRKAREAAA